jgi:hypothetical protein
MPRPISQRIEVGRLLGVPTIPTGETKMTKDEGPGVGHNSTEIKGAIATATKKIVDLKKKRKSINDDIAAERQSVVALGVDRDAFASSLRRYEMDPDVRAEFDRSIALVNEALGIPAQGSLFKDDDLKQHEIPDGVN